MRNTISRNLFEKECKLQFHDFFSKFKDLATVFDERTTVLALSTLFHQKAEQYKENVPKVRISCFNFSLNPLRFFIARENDRNLSTVKSWVICKSSILPNYKVPNDYKLFIIAQLLASSYFGVSFSHERRSERIERRFESQNPSQSHFSGEF